MLKAAHRHHRRAGGGMGFRDRLGPGDAQFIHAGYGILHTKRS
ncbi:hypothetical protein [Thauera sp. SDU_THAU2]